jgi:hypothetical protein
VRCAHFEPTVARAFEIVQQTLSVAGRPLDAGMRLGEWFRAADLPMPSGTDMQGFFRVTDADPMLPRLLAGAAPQAIRLGLSTEDEISRLQSDILSVVARREHCVLWPVVTAAWTRVGAR